MNKPSMEIDFEKCAKAGVEQAMRECELTIGMTLKEAVDRQYPMEHHHTKVFEVRGKARESICPRCLGFIVTKENEYPTFCVWCGQKIRWKD